MALFHFSVKTNKAKTGKNIDGKNHAEYINREGKYKNVDISEQIKAQTFSGNTISAGDPESALSPVTKRNLYKSIYGSIVNAGNNKVKISDNASRETIELSLVLAIKQYGFPLNVEGDSNFKAQIVLSAISLENYNISFTDPAMNKQYTKLKEDEEHERKRITEINNERAERTKVRLASFKSTEGFRNSQNSDSMQELSVCDVDEEQNSTRMLLPDDKPFHLEHKETDGYSFMRRAVYRNKINVEKLANLIIAGRLSSKAASHSEYINRNAEFAVKGGCVYKDVRLPKWAKGSAKKFFAAADRYDKGLPYREFEFSLQKELTLEQNIEIVNTFIKNCDYLKDKYYALAIHDKESSLETGVRQIHCHLMFSDRMIDDFELNHERPAKQFFSRYRPQNPQNGGCKKDRTFSKDAGQKELSDAVTKQRKLLADIINATFKRYGIDEEISHKSLEDQREDALKNKDFIKAEILNRRPEKYLGPQTCANKNNSSVINLQEARRERRKREGLIRAAYQLEKLHLDAKLEYDYAVATDKANTVVISSAKIQPNSGYSVEIMQLKDKILKLSDLLSTKQKDVISFKIANEIARSRFMTADEYEIYKKIKVIPANIFKLKRELKSLDAALPEYEKQKAEIERKLSSWQQNKKALELQLEDANKRLRQPAFKSKITKATNIILRENEPIRKEFEKTMQELDEASLKLREIILKAIEAEQTTIKNTAAQNGRYTAIQIRNILNGITWDIEKAIREKESDISTLEKRVISNERAKVIAEDIVSKGYSKKLREVSASLKKNESSLVRINADIAKIKFNFIGIGKKDPAMYSKLKAALDRYLNKKDILDKQIEKETNYISALKSKLDEYYKRPIIQQKMSSVMQGILTKNLPIRQQYDELCKKSATLKRQYDTVNRLKKAVNQQIQLDRGKNITYALRSGISTSSTGSSSAQQRINAQAIAQAFADHTAGSLVARFNDNEYDEFADAISQNPADRQARESNIEL